MGRYDTGVIPKLTENNGSTVSSSTLHIQAKRQIESNKILLSDVSSELRVFYHHIIGLYVQQ
jgi:hypothetical protein